MQKPVFYKISSTGDLLKALFFSISLPSFFLSFSQEASATGRTFFCGSASYRGEVVPTTYVNPATGGNPIALIYWVKDYFDDPPEKRCSEATGKMQAYYDNGLLQHINTDLVDGLPVICIAENSDGRCTSSDVVVNLRPGTDRFEALDTMLNLVNRLGDVPLEIADDLLFYRRGEDYINLDAFIEEVQTQ